MDRPLFCITICFMAGITTARLFPCNLPVYLLLLITVLLLAGWSMLKGRAGVALLLAAVFATGLLRFGAAAQAVPAGFESLDGKRVELSGKVISETEIRPDGRVVYVVAVRAISVDGQGYSVKTGIRVSSLNYSRQKTYCPGYGDTVALRGTLKLPSGARVPGGFDARFYYAGQGISADLYTYGPPLRAEPSGSGVSGIFIKIREALVRAAYAAMPERQAGLLTGILFGIRDNVAEDVIKDFSDSGIAHILAVSGLHMGFVAGGFYWLARRLTINSTLRVLLSLAGIAAYTGITGARPSVLRAGIMMAVMLAGREFGKTGDSLTSLALAGLVTAAVNPFVIFTPSFQMSYGAVLGILALYRPLRNRLNRLPSFLANTVSVSMAAQLGVIPVTAYYFYRLSLISVVSNVFVIPLAGAAVYLGLATVITGQMSLAAARFIGALNTGLLHIISAIARFFAGVPFSAVDVYSPPHLFIILWYGALVCLAAGWKLKMKLPDRRAAVIWTLVLINVFVWVTAFTRPNGFEITFLDVGQGDAIFIRTPEGYTAMIDFGPGEGFDAGKNIVVPFLKKKRVGRLDAAIITHFHDDHFGGMASVLKSVKTKVLLAPAVPESPVEGAGEIMTLSAGDSFKLGRAKFFVLWPGGDFKPDENNGSLVILADLGGVTALFTGDIEAEAEAEMLKRGVLVPVDVLKVPHHGSDTSSSMEFLKQVCPQYAVISVGKSNRFGHPHSEVLERLEEIGAHVYRTDTGGAATIKIVGNKLHITSFLRRGKTSVAHGPAFIPPPAAAGEY